MHEYDTVLKALLQGSANSAVEQISGSAVVRWLPIELPKVENPRMDLLGETADGGLIHIELQSTNEAQMALRMAEYLLRTFRLHGRFARQIVLYVGEAELSMPRKLTGPHFSFECTILDVRELDAEKLLASPWLSDNIISILGNLSDRREALRRVLKRIAQLSGDERDVKFQQLLLLAGLRRLGEDIGEEAKRMPILSDIMDHDLIGPAIRKGIQQGMQEGLQQGRLNGRREVIGHLIEKRFGKMPAHLEAKFMSLSTPELDALALRVLDAHGPDELF